MTYTLVHDGLDDFWINGVPFIFPKGERAGKGTCADYVVILKNILYIQYYAALLQRRPVTRAVELGFYQGGTAIALALMCPTLKIVSFDSAKSDPNVLARIAALGLSDRIKVHYGVSQTDKETIHRVLAAEFGDGDVELVIDDASHAYDLSRRSFEIMLPLLSAQAVYVLEDWAWAHWGGFYETPEMRDRPGPTNLVFEWVMSVGTRDDMIAHMEIRGGWVTLFRDSPTRFGDVPLDTLYRKRSGDWGVAPTARQPAPTVASEAGPGSTAIDRVAEDPLSAAEARLEGAIADARSGAFMAARAVVAAEVQAFPNELRILHKAGVVMRFCGDSEAALGYFLRALVAYPDFHFTEVEIGDLYTERGEKQEALRWYRKAIASAPDYALSYLRAACLERELGRSWDGLQLLETLHERFPDHIECNMLRAEFLQYHGRRAEMARAYQAAITAGCNDPMVHIGYMRVLTELADYRGVLDFTSRAPPAEPLLAFHAAVWGGHAKLALGVDKAALVEAASRREQSAAWLSTEAVRSRLLSITAAGQKLSLIRLGDGEARFLAFFDDLSRQLVSDKEMECMLDLHWQNWFDVPLASVSPVQLRALAGEFMAALSAVDILGVATAARYEVDAIHRGYLGALERTVAAAQPGIGFTDAFVHICLHRLSPFYAELLSGINFVGVISPHPGLAAKLARYHGIVTFAEYIVPGESRLPADARGTTAVPHFPDRYHEIMAGLLVPRPGAIFLVAAGLLGKIYCHRIQQLGGIALDIGSVVDAWMGFSTRPGQYEPPAAWILPTVA
jgi:tetratricopeptide (TPR) repeat protein